MKRGSVNNLVRVENDLSVTKEYEEGILAKSNNKF